MKKVKVTRRMLESYVSSVINEIKADKAARDMLIRQGIANPTDQQVKERAQDLETAVLRGLLTKKEAYEDAHASTFANLSDVSLQNISNFLSTFNRPTNAGGVSAVTDLQMTTRNGEQGYDFKYTANTTGVDIPETNFLILFNNGDPPADANSFADLAFKTMHATVSTNTMEMPENTGEKLEIALAATFAYIDRTTVYTAKFDSAPGKDLTRAKDSISFESKYTKDQKREINDNFGASQPSLTNTTKYFAFLSSDRGYFVNSPILATVGTVGMESIPKATGYSTDAEQDNIRYNNMVFMFLQSQNDLKSRIIDVLAQFTRFSVVKINKGSSTTNVAATPENIALSQSQGNLTITQVVNSALLDEPTSERLIQMLINSINNAAQRDEIIETLAYISYVSTLSGMDYSVGQKSVVTASTLTPDDRVSFQPFLDGFMNDVCTTSGDLKAFGLIANSPTMMGGFVAKGFRDMLNLLIYAWNLKDDLSLARLPQPSINTAQIAGAQGAARQVGRIRTGTNYSNILKDRAEGGSEDVAASLICNVMNNPNTPQDSKKIQILDDLEDNGDKLSQRVVYPIQQNKPAMVAILTELLRSRAGQSNIYDKYIRIQPEFRQAIRDTIDESLKRALGAFQTYRSSTSQNLLQQFKKDLGKATSKIASQNYLDFENFMIESRENPFWTSFDRRDLWDDPDYDKRLFNIFFKHTYSANGSKTEITDDTQLSSNLLDLMMSAPDLKGFTAIMLQAIKLKADEVFTNALAKAGITLEPSQEQLSQLRNKFSKESLDKVYQDYYEQLTDSEKSEWMSKTEEEKIQILLTAGLVDEEQATSLSRDASRNAPTRAASTAGAESEMKDLRQKLKVGEFSPTAGLSMDDPEFYEIYSEHKLYANIIQDLMETSAKKQRAANKQKKIKITKRQLLALLCRKK